MRIWSNLSDNQHSFRLQETFWKIILENLFSIFRYPVLKIILETKSRKFYSQVLLSLLSLSQIDTHFYTRVTRRKCFRSVSSRSISLLISEFSSFSPSLSLSLSLSSPRVLSWHKKRRGLLSYFLLFLLLPFSLSLFFSYTAGNNVLWRESREFRFS